MKKRFSEERIIGFLADAESGVAVKELCRRHGFSEASYYLWKSKFGGLNVSEAKRLKAIEVENARLKKLLAEGMLEAEVTKEACGERDDRASQARVGTVCEVRGDKSASSIEVRPDDPSASHAGRLGGEHQAGAAHVSGVRPHGQVAHAQESTYGNAPASGAPHSEKRGLEHGLCS